MSRTFKVSLLMTCVILVIGLGVWYYAPRLPAGAFGSFGFQSSPQVTKYVLPPYHTSASAPYSISGNTILGNNGQPYQFYGIGRDSLEYSCTGDGHFSKQELAYLGAGKNTSTATYWRANTVRLPLSEDFWLHGQPKIQCTAQQYQALVRQVVNTLTSLKLNVVLDLQWVDAGGKSLNGGGPWAMPDKDSLLFWQDVASHYRYYSNVLFELLNEPHPASAACWVSGCKMTDKVYSADCHCAKTVTYQAVGMQDLVNVASRTGAKNLMLVAGMNWGYSFTQFPTFPVVGKTVVYDTHPYPYYGKFASDWDTQFGFMRVKYPLISSESGEYDCTSTYLSGLYDYFDAHDIGWFAWSWTTDGNTCGYPRLIQDYQGTPTQSMGQFIYNRLHSYS